MSDISSGILSSISSGIVFGPRPTPSPGRWKIPGNTTAKTCSLSSKSPQKLQDMKPCMKVMQGVAEGKRTKQQDILKNKMKLSWMGSTNRTISENYCAAAFLRHLRSHIKCTCYDRGGRKVEARKSLSKAMIHWMFQSNPGTGCAETARRRPCIGRLG